MVKFPSIAERGSKVKCWGYIQEGLCFLCIFLKSSFKFREKLQSSYRKFQYILLCFLTRQKYSKMIQSSYSVMEGAMSVVNMSHQEPGMHSEAWRRQHVNFPRAKRNQIPQKPLPALPPPTPTPICCNLQMGSVILKSRYHFSSESRAYTCKPAQSYCIP